jgi:gamma-glutamyltranspeptidase/glutathione hydrolase
MISLSSGWRRALSAIVLVIASAAPASTQEQRRLYSPPDLATVRAVSAEHGMVVAQEKIAAQFGADILRQGGNAVDAAVATGFALAVTYPRAGNIGGGGFMVIHSADRNEDIAIDYRETAPLAATRDMYLGADGKPDTDKSRNSALGIGVPGTVAGLALALEKYGSGQFTLAQIIKPAIELARNGFIVADDMADTLPDMYRRMARWPNSAKAFARADGAPLHDGDRLTQVDLAATLSTIADQGPRGFYEGPVAEKLAKAVSDAGGIMTVDDLKSYQAVIRAPVRGNYRGYDIVSMPLPSSGGTVLLETLNILEGFPMSDMKQGTAPSLHVMIEAMKRAYADRARYLGDPRFRQCTDTGPARQGLRPPDSAPASIPRAQRQLLRFCGCPEREGSNTTHYSVVGQGKPTPSATPTPEFPLWRRPGRRRYRRAAQQRLDDFTAAPGAPTPSAWWVLRPIFPAPESGRCRRCRQPSY